MRTIRSFYLGLLIALPLVAMIFLGGLAYGQRNVPTPTIHIEGKILSAKGAGVQGVTVTIADIDAPTQKLIDVVTNFQGKYSKEVPATKNGYTLTPKKGRNTFTPASVNLKAIGGTADFKMN
jgi:hypothetical protein